MEIFNMDEFGDMGGMNTFQQKETIDANNIKDDSIKTDVEDVDSDAYAFFSSLLSLPSLLSFFQEE